MASSKHSRHPKRDKHSKDHKSTYRNGSTLSTNQTNTNQTQRDVTQKEEVQKEEILKEEIQKEEIQNKPTWFFIRDKKYLPEDYKVPQYGAQTRPKFSALLLTVIISIGILFIYTLIFQPLQWVDNIIICIFIPLLAEIVINKIRNHSIHWNYALLWGIMVCIIFPENVDTGWMLFFVVMVWLPIRHLLEPMHLFIIHPITLIMFLLLLFQLIPVPTSEPIEFSLAEQNWEQLLPQLMTATETFYITPFAILIPLLFLLFYLRRLYPVSIVFVPILVWLGVDYALYGWDYIFSLINSLLFSTQGSLFWLLISTFGLSFAYLPRNRTGRWMVILFLSIFLLGFSNPTTYIWNLILGMIVCQLLHFIYQTFIIPPYFQAPFWVKFRGR